MDIISRGFSGRRSAADVKLPAGQYLTTDFPVLSAGPTPHVSLERWEFVIDDGTNVLRRPCCVPALCIASHRRRVLRFVKLARSRVACVMLCYRDWASRLVQSARLWRSWRMSFFVVSPSAFLPHQSAPRHY
jgi:hypothetical protein